MKRIFITFFLTASLLLTAHAQSDSTAFRAYIYNKEYSLYMNIDFYHQQVTVPGHDLYGALPGYLGKERYSFGWPILSAKIDGRKAMITLVNDYGSEDLTASLTLSNDSTYVLRQIEGSPLKMPEKDKWQKLPKTIVFKRK